MRCDTCKQEVPEVMRVVIYKGYDRTLAHAIYNCPACFAKKEQSKPYAQSEKQPPKSQKDQQ